MRTMSAGLCLVAGFIAAATSPATAADAVSELLHLLPREVNAVAVIRAGELLRTPRGMDEGWADKAREQFLAGATELPPDTEILLRGTQLLPGSESERWSVGLLKSSQPIDMVGLAEREKTNVRTLQGVAAIAAQRNCYFLGFGDDVLGILTPGYRQMAARWAVEATDKEPSAVAPYLQEALAQAGPQIVLAVDLQDLFEPEFFQSRLAASTTLNRQAAVQKQLAQALDGLRGIRLTVEVNKLTTATLQLDFASPLPADAVLLKGPLLDVFADLGSELEEFAQAPAVVRGNALVLTADLPDEALRRVVSLISAPPPSMTGKTETPKKPAPASKDNPRGSNRESRQYLQAVNRCLNDLKKLSNRSSNEGRVAQWYLNFARKIEQLPTTDVDMDLLKYGGAQSSRLAALSASLRGMQIEVNALQQAVTYNTEFQPGHMGGWWGLGWTPHTYNITSNLTEVRQQQAAAVTNGARQRAEVWALIEKDREAIRRLMIERYGEDLTIGK